MSITTTSGPTKLRFIRRKGPDGLDYVTVATQETTGEKVQRIAAKVGMAIDRVIFRTDFAECERPKH